MYTGNFAVVSMFPSLLVGTVMFKVKLSVSEWLGTSGNGNECWMKPNSLLIAPTGETGGELLGLARID